MAGEMWARRILEKELGRPVVLNDNNSKPGMYDLRIGDSESPEAAIECVGAVDAIFTETWSVGPAKGPLDLDIRGDWVVKIAPGSHVREIRRRIGPLLAKLEARGIYRVRAGYLLKREDNELHRDLESLGIQDLVCFRPDGSGQVDFTLPGVGGTVDRTGGAVPAWISDFLHAPARSDVLDKLRRSGAKTRHAFVLVSFASAPWPVESYLIGELDQLPSQGPDLPPPVSEVWIVSTFGRKGLRWGGGTWRQFDTRGEGIDDGSPS